MNLMWSSLSGARTTPTARFASQARVPPVPGVGPADPKAGCRESIPPRLSSNDVSAAFSATLRINSMRSQMNKSRIALLAAGMVGLGDLPGGDFSSIAQDVSDDGSVVVGIGNSASGEEAFRWTSHLRDSISTHRWPATSTPTAPSMPRITSFWRKGLGTTYTQNDYDTWRAHFGQTTGIVRDQAPSRGLRGSAVGRHAGAGNLHDAGDGDGHGLFSPSRGAVVISVSVEEPSILFRSEWRGDSCKLPRD